MSVQVSADSRTAGGPQGVAAVPLSRLVQVELRKLVDTRSGRWLLISIALLTAAVVTIFMFAASPQELTFKSFVNATSTPQALLLPILGILTVTSEWGQRTGLVTFTLEPNRSRVAVAKLAAVVLLGLVAVLLAALLAALGNLLGSVLQDGDGSWSFGLSGLRDIVVQQLLAVVQGLALGMLIMVSAAAIVVYFVLPTVWLVATGTSEWFAKVAKWVDLNTTAAPLTAHEMTADAWARLAVSAAIWILLPLVLGWARLLRRELKSA